MSTVRMADGRPIPHRFLQSRAWKAIAVFLAVLFVAGLYFGTLEVHWHVPGVWQGWDLKEDWDVRLGNWLAAHTHGIVTEVNWGPLRHNVRDLGEPAAATLVVLSLSVPAKYWDDRSNQAGWFRCAWTPVAMLVAFIVLVVAGTWAELKINEIPRVQSVVAGPHGGILLLIETLFFGVLVGLVMHRLWLPVGARVQGFIMERSVDNYWRGGGGRLPFYVRKEMILAPELRERWMADFYETTKPMPEAGGKTEADLLKAEGRTATGVAVYATVILAVLFVLWVIALGFIGKFLAAHGVVVPYFAPRG